MEHKEIKNSLDSKLQSLSIYSVRILSILEVIAKTSFSKITKCSTLESVPVKISLEIGEMTKYGWLIMPDCKNLTGPLYMAKLKVSE